MNRLCYIHIIKYRNLSNIGFSFDPRYEISVDEEHKVVSIQKSIGFPSNFWGDTVYSLTAIVGKNGMGKSTVMRFALEALVEGSGGRNDLKGIVVTVDDNNQLSVYVPDFLQDKYKIKSDVCHNNRIENMADLPSIQVFYYGSHFNPLTTPEDILTQQWTGLVNMSDGYLLVRDLQEYGNELTSDGKFALRDYATAFNVQNQYRICYFLQQYNSKIKRQLCLPRYLLIFPNEAGQWAINNRQKHNNKIGLPRYEIPSGWELRDRALASIAYNNMINMMADGRGTEESWLLLIDDWVQTSTKNHKGSIIDEYGQFVEGIKDADYRQLCRYIHESIEMLGNFCMIRSNGVRTCFCCDVEYDKALIDTLLEWIVNHKVYLTSRFFDMYYAHNLESTTFLSSGEQKLLDLYSRIYDSTVRINQRGYKEVMPELFVFDEAETGYHPEWQRQYINNLVLFLNDIVGSQGKQCQIVVTSHSPIILSDIPVESCNMLDHDEDGTPINLRKSREQTFGANVFDLYRDSFFLKEGMVGEFASVYIQGLNDEIVHRLQEDDPPAPQELDFLKTRIKMIGDKVIREYLLSKLKPWDIQEYNYRSIEEFDNE